VFIASQDALGEIEMSGIRYDLEAAINIRDAAELAANGTIDKAQYYALESGALTGYLRALAAKATHDSSLPAIRERIANSMMFDLREASELIDAIRAGIKRQHPDATEVCDVLKDAAQVAYEAFEVGQEREPVDVLEAIGLDRPNLDALTIRRAA